MQSMLQAKLPPEIPPESEQRMEIVPRDGEDMQAAATRMLIGPLASARIALEISVKQSGENLHLAPFAATLARAAKLVSAGNMDDVEATLVNQATALNVMFGELGSVAISYIPKHPETADRFFRMAMKTQNQCRMTLETLSNMKNPPVIYARQTNIANGPQQVNNGPMPSALQGSENYNTPNKLLERGNEQRMDIPTQNSTGSSNTAVEAVAAVNRASNSVGQGEG